MTIVYRSVKGSNLTAAEVDGNFTDLDGRATALEALDIGKSIESIDVTGNVMTITYTDASIDTFTLPTASLIDMFRGEWQPLTPYVEGQLVTATGSIFAVLQDHTSGSTFDPHATLGTAGDLYQLWLKNPAIPRIERSDTTFDPVFSDANSYNRCTNAAGCTVTIPENDDVPFDLGTELHFRQCQTGGVFIVEGSTGVLINGVSGYNNNTDTQGAVVTLKKVDTDEWDLFGRLKSGTG